MSCRFFVPLCHCTMPLHSCWWSRLVPGSRIWSGPFTRGSSLSRIGTRTGPVSSKIVPDRLKGPDRSGTRKGSGPRTKALVCCQVDQCWINFFTKYFEPEISLNQEQKNVKNLSRSILKSISTRKEN